MSKYINAGLYYVPISRNTSTEIPINSYGSVIERKLPSVDIKKNVIPQEVDPEIK
jgi:hypothetical protein